MKVKLDNNGAAIFISFPRDNGLVLVMHMHVSAVVRTMIKLEKNLFKRRKLRLEKQRIDFNCKSLTVTF